MKIIFMMMACAVALMLSLGNPVCAQERSTSSGDTLMVWQSVFSLTGFKYSFGKLEGDVGMGGSNVKKVVNDNALALHEMETFGKFQIPSFIAALVSAGVLGWGLGSDHDDLIYIGLGGLVASLVVDQIGYSHLKKGVKIYNDAVR